MIYDPERYVVCIGLMWKIKIRLSKLLIGTQCVYTYNTLQKNKNHMCEKTD